MTTLPVLALMGPTATGKTECAVALVRRMPFEIISVDSAMIYRGLDIGSAKPAAAVQAEAPHRMIDILEPTESYSAYRFARQAEAHIRDIHQHGRIPLLVGGARLYFLALMRGLSEIPDIDAAVRDQLRRECAAHGVQPLYERLRHCDPTAAARLEPTDTQRVLRALEVYQSSGCPLSEWQAQAPAPSADINYHQLVLWPQDRSRLHRRIGQRFDQMLESGLIEEVERLRARKDLSLEHPSMRCVGYRQVWRHLDGDITKAQMRDQAVAVTRQLAKRQLTWLRHEKDVLHCSVDGPQPEKVVAAVEQTMFHEVRGTGISPEK